MDCSSWTVVCVSGIIYQTNLMQFFLVEKVVFASSTLPVFLKLLSHDIRWQILKALAQSDLRVQELAGTVGRAQNLVSYHLLQLREQGLVHERRSIADGREVYYSLDLGQLRTLLQASGDELHPALGSPLPARYLGKDDLPPARVLFLCTHNLARSQMAEGLLRDRSQGRLEVFSAGNQPSQVHPLAVRAMQEMGIDISGQHSKSIDGFLWQSFDYIITVCDRARETCPIFPGDPVLIHWSTPDPSTVQGSQEVRYKAFRDTAVQLRTRIGYLLMILQRKKNGAVQTEIDREE
jgi:ArsR family transcriptional regulator, arsenate/arsenite/antimonite-responsive transcriptional repressor / arsenate reductase (thioredoxin)